jgi:hypothetical protein
MSYTYLSHKTVNIKKPHMCFCCAKKSEPPAKMIYQTGVCDGEFSATYQCLVCNEFMTPKKWEDCDYEMGEGDIWEDRDYEQFRKDKLKPQAA